MQRALVYFTLFLGIGALALFFMPLRLAISMAELEDAQFSAKDINGSIWNGRIESARLGSIALGDLDASTRVLPLFTGQILLDLSRAANGADAGLTATIGKIGQSLLVRDAAASFSIGPQLAPLPASEVTLDGFSAAFANGRCQSASGKVRLSLDANIPGLDLKQGLLGNALCQNGALVLPLKSGSGMEKLTVKVEGNGTYAARLTLSGSESLWTLLLPTLGFQKVPGGYAMKTAGQLGQRDKM